MVRATRPQGRADAQRDARTPCRRSQDPKNEIALLSPEDVSSAISKSYESPKRFVRWQPRLVSTKLPIYIPTSNRRSALPGQHAIRFS
jgi:hypothetical protein